MLQLIILCWKDEQKNYYVHELPPHVNVRPFISPQNGNAIDPLLCSMYLMQCPRADTLVWIWYIDKSTIRHCGGCVAHCFKPRLAKPVSESERGKEGWCQTCDDSERQEDCCKYIVQHVIVCYAVVQPGCCGFVTGSPPSLAVWLSGRVIHRM